MRPNVELGRTFFVEEPLSAYDTIDLRFPSCVNKRKMAILTKPSPSPLWTWPEPGQWTYEDWLQLPDDGTRYEVIDGELYMSPPPAIPHQTSSGNLDFSFRRHVRDHDLGRIFTAPVGVRLPGYPVPFQPDIVFISKAREHIISTRYIEGVPDLIVEILSPSNWAYDRDEKFKVYRDADVPELWLVDYRKKTVEVFVWEEGEYVLQKGVLKVGDMAESNVLNGFAVQVAEIFEGV